MESSGRRKEKLQKDSKEKKKKERKLKIKTLELLCEEKGSPLFLLCLVATCDAT